MSSFRAVISAVSFHIYHSLTDRAACRERQVDSLQATYLSIGDSDNSKETHFTRIYGPINEIRLYPFS